MEVVEAQMERTEIEIRIYRRKKTWLVTIQPSSGFELQKHAEREREMCRITVICDLEKGVEKFKLEEHMWL